jgi:alpha-tubulin suppressor-like RCC1 family protein
MRFFVACRIALVAAFLSGCDADRPMSPGLFVLDDIGTGRWSSVSTGGDHTCALDRDGRAYCWGSNSEFQLGVDHTAEACGSAAAACQPSPTAVATGRTFSAISAGGSHTCAIATDSVPFCWGRNSDGQLGVPGDDSVEPRIPGSALMISISAGRVHSCGVRADNLLVCWGSNRGGAVGAGAGSRVAPTLVGGNQRFTAVEASDDRTCARTVSGRVMCWGLLWEYTSNDTNFTDVRSSPAFVPSLGAMAGMDVGRNSACSVDASGFLWCWETNLYGERGAGPGDGSKTPRRVASDEEFVAVTVGNAHACGVTKLGVGYCWGSNRTLQLGTIASEFCGAARTPCSTYPVRISGLQRFVSLSAGLGGHVCGVTDQFNLYCWGAGSHGQRGDGTTTFASRLPRLAARVSQE